MAMKALVKKCLASLGYEVRKVQRGGAAPGSALSAIEHNSQAMRDSFYSDPQQVEGYLTQERRQFYRDVTGLLSKHVPRLGESALSIADYGCGPGLLLKHLGTCSPRSKCHGYDFSPSGLRIARGNFPAAHFETRDLYQAYTDRYDIILCTEVLEHLERPRAALENLIQQLAPGGNLLLTVPDGRVDQYAGHIHFWSPESWQLFVTEAAGDLAVLTGRVASRGPIPFLFAVVTRPGEGGPAHAARSTVSGVATHA
jgi:2-polyprenyl-3-methyl-5-hydroxy-6-metoxy-1,4-benzoquinol methylase